MPGAIMDAIKSGVRFVGTIAFALLAPITGAPTVVGAPASPATQVSEIPDKFVMPEAEKDYLRRTEMIPTRDGVRLYTVIIIPKGAKDAPIVLSRTPNNATRLFSNNDPSMAGLVPSADIEFARAGYIRVYQDVRGKYGSEGAFELTRPPRGPLNATDTDETTDAWDTIDWLIRNVPQSNGKVGMIGSGSDGFMVAMALLDPHPALKAAVSEEPKMDNWMGDDWYHYGAFRQPNMDYFAFMTGYRGAGSYDPLPRAAYDDYEVFLNAGSPGAFALANGFDQLSWWKKMVAHPAYDAFWQGYALDRQVAAHPSRVPTLWVDGLWNEQTIWGAPHAWLALKAAGHESTNWLVIGPWYAFQEVRRSGGWNLGVFKWPGDTAKEFRHSMVMPFFNQYLRDGPPANLARATIYSPAEKRWQRFDTWPSACERGCTYPLKALYLQADFKLSFNRPTGLREGDSYVSDPAKPVPYLPRPLSVTDDDSWSTQLVHDQRFVDGRPDVLTYVTEALSAPLKIEGAPIADLVATTTGTDEDFVVKLIDVYPPQYPLQPELGGYELPIGIDIFRGRYRTSFEHPSPIPANKAQRYRFELPNQNYVFLPGHRIMVQIQSTLFPLYDRNPQTFVDNPLFPKPGDFRKATITLLRSADAASAVWLPVVPYVNSGNF
jgi:putative CocE/NonD family hydrolase